MKLKGEEKKFWQRYFRIEKIEDIPKEWSLIGGYGRGDEQFDEYFTLSVCVLISFMKLF